MPIVLTSLTTFPGLGPLPFEKSKGVQFVTPMGVPLAFGVIFATVISLFLVPCGYLILEHPKRALGVGQASPPSESNLGEPLLIHAPLEEAGDGTRGQ